jgi:hypothetical protein
MYATSAMILQVSLSFALLVSARALPSTPSGNVASAAPSAIGPTPGDFKLYAITYDPEFNTDADAAKKFNNSYIGYTTDGDGITTLTGDADQSSAPVWTLDHTTHILTALHGSPVKQAGALVLSNTTNTASTSLQEAAGYGQAALDTSGGSPSQFTIEENYPDGTGSSIAYYGSKGYTLIFGSFVMCEVPNTAGAASYTLLWRGSSKAVWKTPSGCALVKLGLDYELYPHPTSSSA